LSLVIVASEDITFSLCTIYKHWPTISEELDTIFHDMQPFLYANLMTQYFMELTSS